MPTGIVTTAWPRVVAQCAKWGVRFDPWQHGIGQIALGKRKNGKYAATVGGVVMSIPRQVGKTYLVGMIVLALCALTPNLTVVWTAHRERTNSNTFLKLKSLAEKPKIRPLLSGPPRTGKGDQEIRFLNGSRLVFGAREQGFGRGFDEVDVEVFDEAQILTEKALEDMVAATNQSRQPAGALLFFMGTPPRPIDPGEEFTNRRNKALSGKSTEMVYVEFSADPDADPDDMAQVAKANPSYPLRTPQESIDRLRENLTDNESYMREGLGVWSPTSNANFVIPREMWDSSGDDMAVAVDRFALGVEVGPDLASASVVLAGQREDGSWHVELDETRDGTAWLAPYLEALVAANPQIRAVAIDAGSPAKALISQHPTEKSHGKPVWYLNGTKVRVIPPAVQDLGAACATLLAGVISGSVRHIKQGQLTAAATTAGKRKLGDTGMWVWSRATSTSDITPIQAATLALWAAQLETIYKKPLVRRTGQRRAVVM